jgi:hypothetical protein
VKIMGEGGRSKRCNDEPSGSNMRFKGDTFFIED